MPNVLTFLFVPYIAIIISSIFSISFFNFLYLDDRIKTSNYNKVLLDSTSFNNQDSFTSHWNMYYPWGKDHNGSARMYPDQVILEPNGVMKITAQRVQKSEGNSSKDPWLKINFHSGAIHLKEQIKVSNNLPKWMISGDFQVPTDKGSWPAFWITGSKTWPPEIDIMEFKGSNINWQNTATGPNWNNVSWQNKLTPISDAAHWHNYKIIMEKISDKDVKITYFIDNVATATHKANFVNKPFWLIINMQMDGDSGSSDESLKTAVMRARNVKVIAYSSI
jgi:hypothetical protein